MILLNNDFSDGDTKITARQGAYIIQACNLIGSIASIFLINNYGRRPILLSGMAGIALSLVGIAVVFEIDSSVALLVLICLVSFLFQFTLGPLAPLYAAEVCTDVALGATMITEDVTVLFQDFVTPPLLSSSMGPVGVFLMYGIFSVTGFFFIYFYVPETKGLS